MSAKSKGRPGLRWRAGTLWDIASQVNNRELGADAAIKKFAKHPDPEDFKMVLQDAKNLGREMFMRKYTKKDTVKKTQAISLDALPEALRESIRDLEAQEQRLAQELAEVRESKARYEKVLKGLEA